MQNRGAVDVSQGDAPAGPQEVPDPVDHRFAELGQEHAAQRALRHRLRRAQAQAARGADHQGHLVQRRIALQHHHPRRRGQRLQRARGTHRTHRPTQKI